MNPITKEIFNKDDSSLLKYNLDENDEYIEPLFYIPVLPVILINGTIGIGTGYSTNIPSFNPKDIINNIIRYLNGKEFNKMIPWYKGFKGKIELGNTEESFTISGVYTTNNKTKTINISEIPIGTSIEDYKEFLNNLEEKYTNIKKIHINKSSKNEINVDIVFDNTTNFEKFIELDLI